MQKAIGDFVSSARFQSAILWVILFNAAILGLQTSPTVMGVAGSAIVAADTLCLAIFVAELCLKFLAFGPKMFRSGWNVFDFLVISVAFVPGGGGITVLRALRVLRVLRLVSVSPALRKVVDGLVIALPGMGSVMLLLAMLFYLGAVMATNLFGSTFDEWFGTIGRSGYSLFQIMTLESWSMGIVRPVMKEYPYAWAFFVPFIMVTTFATVNLFVGLVVNSLQEAASEDANKEEDAFREEVLVRLAAIEAALARPAAAAPVEPAPQADGLPKSPSP